jgi:hypothetical protein
MMCMFCLTQEYKKILQKIALANQSSVYFLKIGNKNKMLPTLLPSLFLQQKIPRVFEIGKSFSAYCNIYVHNRGYICNISFSS